METLTVESGKPFEWRRGLRLQATEETQLILPGALWVQGQALGSIVEVSDDGARVAIDQSNDGSITRIRVFLKPGQCVTLHRNSEAVAIAKNSKQIALQVLQSGNAA